MAQINDMEFLTIDDVAIALRISSLTVMSYIKAGQLKACRIGRAVRIRKMDFEQFVDSNVITNERK